MDGGTTQGRVLRRLYQGLHFAEDFASHLNQNVIYGNDALCLFIECYENIRHLSYLLL